MTEQRAQKGIGKRLLVSPSPVPRLASRFRGLTLIELVIVCGIIAMLAGIIFILSTSVQSRVRETVCRSNLRTLFHALQMYRQDWDGIDPDGRPLQCYEVGFIPLCTYLSSLRTYGVARANMFCPNDPEVRPNDLLLWDPPSHTHLYASSYSMGWWPSRKEVYYFADNPPFPTVIAKRGLELPVWVCYWHRGSEYPYRVLVIRLNGQLKTIFATYDMDIWEL